MIYRAFFRLVLQRFDSEKAHALAIRTLRLVAAIPGALTFLDWMLRPRSKGLRVDVLGLEFRSPLGVAAGVDKDATIFDPLMALGFGAVEVGTVTAEPQAGNDKPRVSRLPHDRALLNAMGFPNEGADACAGRLSQRRTHDVIGVNIGKSKAAQLNEAVADYRASTRKLMPFADYIALNVSSPNTPNLRQMQTVDRLVELVAGVRKELQAERRSVPLLVKLGPDLLNGEIEEIAEMAVRIKLDGIIAVNTTTDMHVATLSQADIAEKKHRGGISGKPLKDRAYEVLELLHANAEGVPLISVGGIDTADDAWQRILCGATLVQAHTAFVYGGPLWPQRMNRGIARRLQESEWSSVSEAVGKGSAITATYEAGTHTEATSPESPASRHTSIV